METCKISVIHKIIFVTGLGCNSMLNLLVRYIAPIFIIGSPSAAQIPAINNRVIGLGSKKYAMQENKGTTNAIILIKCLRVFFCSSTNPIEIK